MLGVVRMCRLWARNYAGTGDFNRCKVIENSRDHTHDSCSRWLRVTLIDRLLTSSLTNVD